MNLKKVKAVKDRGEVYRRWVVDIDKGLSDKGLCRRAFNLSLCASVFNRFLPVPDISAFFINSITTIYNNRLDTIYRMEFRIFFFFAIHLHFV